MNLDALRESLGKFVEESPLNRLPEIGLQRIYEPPLVAVAAAADPLFAELKQPSAIGAFHLGPEEWLPGACSVIGYFLPFSEAVRRSNAGAGLPSKEWLYGRIEGEGMNNALRQYLAQLLQDQQAQTLIPVADPRFRVEQNRANWSERHVGYIAGLGTFGLHTSLITRAGCAGRLGSVITTLPLPVTVRPYRGLEEYCIHCNACAPRCPGGAITPAGKSHALCQQFQQEKVVPFFKPRYGCGKCLTAVPCEHCAPGAARPH